MSSARERDAGFLWSPIFLGEGPGVRRDGRGREGEGARRGVGSEPERRGRSKGLLSENKLPTLLGAQVLQEEPEGSRHGRLSVCVF